MSYRPATIDDAALIYRMRRQAENQPWYQPEPTDWYAHLAWLEPRINNPLITMQIWQPFGHPLGILRIDSNGELTHHAHDNNTAQRMLTAATPYAAQHAGRLKCTLDKDDPRNHQLTQAGWTTYPATAHILRP
jgi:hypothetical protein